MNLRRNLQHLC